MDKNNLKNKKSGIMNKNQKIKKKSKINRLTLFNQQFIYFTVINYIIN